jgi:hypothetical protein
MAMRVSVAKSSWMFAVSHFEPSLTKTSSGAMAAPRAWKSCPAIASRRKS